MVGTAKARASTTKQRRELIACRIHISPRCQGLVILGSMLVAWVTVVATCLSPFIAVQATIALGRRKEKRDRQLQLFRTLMLTRDSLVSFEHVRALNTIEIDFHGEKGAQPVVDAWHTYYVHLNLPLFTVDAEKVAWSNTRLELLTALLAAMAKFLGYRFESSLIRDTAYSPRLHGQLNDEQTQIRTMMLELLGGKRALPVATFAVPIPTNDANSEPAQDGQAAIRPRRPPDLARRDQRGRGACSRRGQACGRRSVDARRRCRGEAHRRNELAQGRHIAGAVDDRNDGGDGVQDRDRRFTRNIEAAVRRATRHPRE